MRSKIWTLAITGTIAVPAGATIYDQQFDSVVANPVVQSLATAFGYAITACDLNGDGADDLVIGDFQTPVTGPLQGAGTVYLYNGAPGVLPSGGPSDADATLTGTNLFMEFGIALACADVNGDGYGDLVASSVQAVRIFHGGPTGIASGSATSANTLLTGNVANTSFGTALANAGDVNGDGYDDLAIGARANYDAGTVSYVYVFHGSASGIASGPASGANTIVNQPVGSPRTVIGEHIAGGGDLDGDGYDDLVLGRLQEPASSSSSTTTLDSGIFRGGATGIASGSFASAAAILIGSTSSNLGLASAIADLDGDGYADLTIGSPDYTLDGKGALVGFAGRSGGIPSGNESGARSVIDGLFTNGKLGWPVANVGDVNGDGIDDIGAAAVFDNGPHTFGAGAGYVVLGGGRQGPPSGSASTRAIARLLAPADHYGDYLGWGGVVGGDFDADGYSDFAIASPRYMNVDQWPAGAALGAVFIARGGPIPACDDTIDNDGDGLIDFPNDPSCVLPESNGEIPQCSDHVDNDGDGKTDFPADPQCKTRFGNSEAPPRSCGIGAELAIALALAAQLGRRSRARVS